MSSNLFDVAKALYPETTVVSGSSSKCFATVLSAHKDSDSYYWDSEVGFCELRCWLAQTAAFVPLNKEGATVVVNKDNFITHLGAIGFSHKISFQPEVEAKIGGVAFDIKDEVSSL